MKYFLKSISLIVLVTISLIFMNSSDSEEVQVTNHKSTVMVASESSIMNLIYNDRYEAIVDYIKLHEGFCRVPYKCPAGYPTIGYGHLIQSGESFTEMTEDEAEILLRCDLNRSVELARKLSPNLNRIQQLAIGHFIYSLGCGTYRRSTLKRLIDSDYPVELIGNELVKYCNYITPKGEIRRSELAYEMRSFEYQIFYTGDSLRNAYSHYDTITDCKIVYYDVQ